jgi:aldose 1-epimerase
LPGGVGAYRRVRTTGLPVLAPWANRLSARAYRAGRVARLRAGLEYAGAELLAAFPFPHRLETAIEVDGRSLSVTATIRPSGRRSVPVSFGYHPYFRLPGGRRVAWRLQLPRRRHVELDECGIPTGQSAEAPAESEPIGARSFDDLFELIGDRRLAIQHGTRRLNRPLRRRLPVRAGLRSAGRGFACLEPMTAPTNALVAGDCPVVAPGGSFTARFSIRPERIQPGTT